MKNNFRARGLFLVCLGTLLWGVSGTVAQYLFQIEGFSTEWLVDMRMLFTGFILLIVGIIKKDSNLLKIWSNKRDVITLIVFSIVGMLGVQITYFEAIDYGNAATATILQYLAPIVILVYLALKSRKLPSVRQVICVGLALFGTILIITKGDFGTLSISKVALFWGICSAFASAVYTLQPIKLLGKYGSTTVIAWGMLIGGGIFASFYPPTKGTGHWSIESILAILFVVIFGTLVAFYCYLESLKYISGYEASVLGCIEPLSAAILSILFLNVVFTTIQWIGTLFILITITVLSLFKEKEEDEKV